MALPNVKTLQDCADFGLTVRPFIPQLTTLPLQLLQSWSNPQELKEIYMATNPLISALAFSLFISPIFVLISEINKNYSQVDRAWSLLPTVYNTHFVIYAHMAGLPTQRMDTMLAFSGVWSLRLTYNYWRKGGYSVGSEDYRWEILRQHINPGLFFIFNVLFIAFAQSILLFSITTPSYILLLAGPITGDASTNVDLIFSRVLVGLVLLEFFADQQQWNFQTAKANYKKTGQASLQYPAEDLERGFVVTGLWSWSRHPNFAAEQTIWVCLYQWATYVAESYFNWTIGGAVSYLILFQASTWFTELISARKYPEYKEYQARVGKFFPRPSIDAPGDFSDVTKRETASEALSKKAEKARQKVKDATEKSQ